MNKIYKYLKSHRVKLSWALAGLIFIYVYTFTPFLGGIWVVNGLKLPPNPNFFIVASKRQASTDKMHASFEELEAKTNYAKIVESQDDTCYKGANNWKIKDGYSHKCTVKITKFYGFSGDFKSQLLDLDKKLTSLGWNDSYGGIKSDITDYDRYIGTVKATTAEFTARTGFKEIRYTVDELPDAEYITNSKQRVQFAYAEANTTLDKVRQNFDYIQTGFSSGSTYTNNNAVSTDAVINKAIGKTDYVIAVSMQDDYFTN